MLPPSALAPPDMTVPELSRAVWTLDMRVDDLASLVARRYIGDHQHEPSHIVGAMAAAVEGAG